MPRWSRRHSHRTYRGALVVVLCRVGGVTSACQEGARWAGAFECLCGSVRAGLFCTVTAHWVDGRAFRFCRRAGCLCRRHEHRPDAALSHLVFFCLLLNRLGARWLGDRRVLLLAVPVRVRTLDPQPVRPPPPSYPPMALATTGGFFSALLSPPIRCLSAPPLARRQRQHLPAAWVTTSSPPPP